VKKEKEVKKLPARPLGNPFVGPRIDPVGSKIARLISLN